jgi:hypothetical protein
MSEPLPRPARCDALPEHTDYADTGCEIAPSCLNCPLPKCRYDMPGGLAAMLRSTRDVAIADAVRRRQLPIDDVAAMFGLSRRSVFRALRRVPDPPHPSKPA